MIQCYDTEGSVLLSVSYFIRQEAVSQNDKDYGKEQHISAYSGTKDQSKKAESIPGVCGGRCSEHK